MASAPDPTPVLDYVPKSPVAAAGETAIETSDIPPVKLGDSTITVTDAVAPEHADDKPVEAAEVDPLEPSITLSDHAVGLNSLSGELDLDKHVC
jgi:hypothetical protein